MLRFAEMAYILLKIFLTLIALNAKGSLGQDTLDMISIDCGAVSNYTDPFTQIYWTTDDAYISAGKSVSAVPVSVGMSGELASLRYFPEKQTKFCYVVPIISNATYLIRSHFWYGNYDRANSPPKFNVAIDSTALGYMDTSGFIAVDGYAEVIYRTAESATTLSYCLYADETSKGSPLISALVFRQVPDRSYSYTRVLTGQFSLLYLRYNYGGSEKIRYPDDPLDRIWDPWKPQAPLTAISTAVNVTDPNGYFLKPVSKVMQTAMTTPTITPLALQVNHGNPDFGVVSCTVYFYFAEVDSSVNATSRVFTLDTGTSSQVINPFNDSGGAFHPTVWGIRNFSMTSSSVVTLNPVSGTTYPPLINAIEAYRNTPDATPGTDAQDVAALVKIKATLGLTHWGGDPCLPVPINWISCSAVTSSPARVTSVRLSNFNLSGSIPAEFADLTALQTLWLDNNRLSGGIPNLQTLKELVSLHLNDNSLSGVIPESLAFIPTLKELFLQNNNLTGTVPEALRNKTGLKLNINGNPACGPTCSSPVTTDSGSKSNVGLIAGVVGAVVGTLLVIGLLFLFCFCRRRRSTKEKEQQLSSNHLTFHSGSKDKAKTGAANTVLDMSGGSTQGARPFTFSELKAATSNFSKEIGKGGFGSVFYGKLANGKEVAVKVSDSKSRQGPAEFNNEVQLLSKVHHKNLVSLLGYCQEDEKQMLVYEYLHKGTVREHLYGSPLATLEPLIWSKRLDVALNAAQGLEYLHSGCSPSIIHRDIKSSNILLTDAYIAKVADFGLSRLGPEESSGATHVSTVVKGTAGYLDPEFWSSNHLSEKSDVYSFGVVLLEILCGRQPIDNTLSDKGQMSIVEWVRNSLLAGNIDSILDPAVRRCNPSIESVWKIAEIAIQCVEPRGAHRPYMREVVKEIREAILAEKGHSESVVMDQSFIGNIPDPEAYNGGHIEEQYSSSHPSSSFNQYNGGPLVR